MEQKNIYQKLFEIQKGLTAFLQTEESASKDKNNKPRYSYTPGYVILDAVKNKMNEHGIMLETRMLNVQHKQISRTIYKETLNGEISPFQIDSILAEVTCEYFWRDVTTGETTEKDKIQWTSLGDNGTDKSLATAIAFNKRYFLMNYFMLTTKDKSDEPDAIDNDRIPGINNSGTIQAKPIQTPMQMPMQQQMPAQQYGQPYVQQYPPQAYQQPYPQPQPYPQQPFIQQMPQQAPNNNVDIYTSAVQNLAMFASGTPTHNDKLQYWLIQLNKCGHNTADPSFSKRLTEDAQALREGRKPNYNI